MGMLRVGVGQHSVPTPNPSIWQALVGLGGCVPWVWGGFWQFFGITTITTNTTEFFTPQNISYHHQPSPNGSCTVNTQKDPVSATLR